MKDTNLFYQVEKNAALVFPDGSCVYGYGIGKSGLVQGEICFNTAITGYQEILTDPSYLGQIITFTFPHIGNIGSNFQDIEGNSIRARGLIIREPITSPSNYRSQENLNYWLEKNNFPSGFQILCWNCNFAKGSLGKCPHELNKMKN